MKRIFAPLITAAVFAASPAVARGGMSKEEIARLPQDKVSAIKQACLRHGVMISTCASTARISSIAHCNF